MGEKHFCRRRNRGKKDDQHDRDRYRPKRGKPVDKRKLERRGKVRPDEWTETEVLMGSITQDYGEKQTKDIL